MKELFSILAYSSNKNSKEGIEKTVLGGKVSVFRRSILLSCLRRAYKSYDNAITRREEEDRRPFWLTWVKRGDQRQKVMYFGEQGMERGYDRRERKKDDAERAARRRKIAEGKVVANFEDDGDFVGWWSYGSLIAMFARTRKVAIASLFETVLYLFVPWFYAVGDKRLVQVDCDGEVPSMKDKDMESILKTLSKKSLQMIWASSRSNAIEDLTTIPRSIVAEDDDVGSANASNQEIFRAFAEERCELQIHVSHDVAVHKSGRGAGKRQRKGTSVRTLTRSPTLLDAAIQYMYALSGGERVAAATDMMRFNSSSLVSIYLLVLDIRDMLEAARPGCVTKAHDCDTEDARSHVNETIADMNTLFDSLNPNTQLQGRAFNRCIWGVSEEMYQAHHTEGTSLHGNAARYRGYSSQASALLDGEDEILDGRSAERAGSASRARGKERSSDRGHGTSVACGDLQRSRQHDRSRERKDSGDKFGGEDFIEDHEEYVEDEYGQEENDEDEHVESEA